MRPHSGSFRDPSGRVFTRNGVIYRSVFEQGTRDFVAARDAGIYDRLIRDRLLIPHKEIGVEDWAPPGTVFCLTHPLIPMVSYPWEWAFSMLKDAAMIHLDAMEVLVPLGFWLRDASAFNVQFCGEGLRLMDTLSVGRRIPDSPWVAYGQFGSHFLAPLALAAYGDVRTLSLWRSHIDGYPLDLATGLLPFRRMCRPGLLMHLVLHARAQRMADRKEDIGKATTVSRPRVSDRGLMGIIRSLRKTIEGIKWERRSPIWEAYGEIRTYRPEDVARKSGYVDKVVGRMQPRMVWDLGANTGEFSLIAASHGAFVVSIDGDPACTEHLYETMARGAGEKRILPLTMDLANPSPGLGWRGRERSSLEDRGPAELVLALALVHHLVLSSCVPLPLIAEWLSSLGNRVLVEFPPPSDPMVKKLLVNRGDEHLPYNRHLFERSFEDYFDPVDSEVLDSGRILFLYERSKRAHATAGPVF